MSRHPRVMVPNVGPMDHAWDLIGEWETVFELPEAPDDEVQVPGRDEPPVHGRMVFPSWSSAELKLDPVEAARAGLPVKVNLERASRVHLTDAGGGALQFVLQAPDCEWSLQATLWPGALHLFVHDEDEDELLWLARGTRRREYYLQKYPVQGEG